MKHKNNTSHYNPAALVEILTRAEDTDLMRMEAQTKQKLAKQRDPARRKTLEINLCYVQREIQLRQERKLAHSEYLNSLPRKAQPK